MSEFPKLIGITGKKQHGKDTLGQFFVNNYDFERLAFADALKEACRHIFGFTEEQLYGNKKEDIDEFWGVSPRTVYQYVGTDLFREQMYKIIPKTGKNIWVDVIKKQILDKWKKNPNICFVITDVRFDNEVDMIRKMGGIMIKVVRSIENSDDNHPSESNVDSLSVDHIVLNNGSKTTMYNNIISYLNRFT